MHKISSLFNLDNSISKNYLSKYEYPWEALKGIKDLILELVSKLGDEYKEISKNVWVHKTAKIYSSAYLGAPCIIGANTEIRHCAFIRESALIGDNCVIGNSCELKNVIIFDYAEIPHFNYVGDSILGYHAHMGAGSITSNVKSDKKNVVIHNGKENSETGLRKVGAFIGDYAEIGCNTVLNPGTIIGKHSIVYPLSSVRGVVPEYSIYKNDGTIVKREKDK